MLGLQNLNDSSKAGACGSRAPSRRFRVEGFLRFLTQSTQNSRKVQVLNDGPSCPQPRVMETSFSWQCEAWRNSN